MVVVPNPHNLIGCLQELKQVIFSSNTNKSNVSKNQQIFSFSQEIKAINPLNFFSVMQEDNQVSFYWQNSKKKEAYVAIGAIAILDIVADNHKSYTNQKRFEDCQKFINNYQENIEFISEDPKLNEAYFFSYFSFFDKNNHHNHFPSTSIFLPYIQLIKKEEQYVLTINTYDNIEWIREYINNHNLSQELNISYQNQINSHHHHGNLMDDYEIDDKQYGSFLNKVNQGLEAIATQKLTKIVVAHALEVKTKANFNLIRSLENLRENHPDCYIFAIGNQQQEYFIGASPERLLSIKRNQLVSDALAGSAPRGKEPEEDQFLGEQLLSGEKEKREHQVVCDFIFAQLQKMHLSPKKASLQLLKLSNIQHLWTPIYAQINNNVHPLEIISQLHPTPAVAGEPMAIACQEIEKSENFERSLYASPIGWVNTNGDCEFIVGIRSALIQHNKATLYAGAGIVAGSQPEQELAEIKLKFQALLQALK